MTSTIGGSHRAGILPATNGGAAAVDTAGKAIYGGMPGFVLGLRAFRRYHA